MARLILGKLKISNPVPPCVALEMSNPSYTLPNATATIAYNNSFTLTGSEPFSVIVNDKPDWMNISVNVNSILFTGTPVLSSIGVDVDIDITNCSAADSINFTDIIDVAPIPCTALIFTNPSFVLPNATTNIAYNQSFTTSGSLPIDLVINSKPTWMTIAVNNNVVRFTGTPISAATGVSIDVDLNNCSGNNTLNFTDSIDIITPCVSVAMSNPSFTLPDAQSTVAYTSSFTLTGTTPFVLGIVQKPTWLNISLAGSTVTLTGTPTTVINNEIVNISLTNCSGGDTIYFIDGFNVNSAPCIGVTRTNPGFTLPDVEQNVVYSSSFALSGTAPFALAIVSKPAWMTIQIIGSNVFFSGTPTTSATGVSVSINISNCSGGTTINFTDTINVNAPACTNVTMTNLSFVLPDAQVGVIYSSSFALLGTSPFNVVINTKPSWMTIQVVGSNVFFSGTPTAIGTNIAVNINITNCATVGNINFADTINISAAPCIGIVKTNPAFSLPDATQNVTYNSSFAITGTTPYTLTVNSKPSWMTVAIIGTNVTFSGTPTATATNQAVNILVTNCLGANSITHIDTINVIAPVGRQGIIFYSGFENDPVTLAPGYTSQGFNTYIQQADNNNPQLSSRSTTFARAGSSSMKLIVDRARTQAADQGHTQLTHIDFPEGAIGEGTERWYGSSYYLPTDYIATDIEFIRQWHHDDNDGSPPMGLATNNGRFQWVYDTTATSGDKFIDLGAYTTGKWTDIVLHIIHSSNAAIAVSQIWIDGVLKLDLRTGGTLGQGTAANKYVGLNNITMVGLYKWVYKIPGFSPTTTRTIYIDEYRIGDATSNLASVSP